MRADNVTVMMDSEENVNSEKKPITWIVYERRRITKADSAPDKANETQESMPSAFPTLIRKMEMSHVSRGFWLGLPKKFCDEHMPKKDVNNTFMLEDEMGNEYGTTYKSEKRGLSSGWRGFSRKHKLKKGDRLVFELVQPHRFKVYINRRTGNDSVEAISGIHPEPLTVEDEDELEEDDKMVTSDGITFEENVLRFEDVKSFADFKIVHNGLNLDSKISEETRVKYYELCKHQEDYLHRNLIGDANIYLVIGLIKQAVQVSNALRELKLTIPLETLSKGLKCCEIVGMEVGFLRARLNETIALCSEHPEVVQMMADRDRVEEETRRSEAKLGKVNGSIAAVDAELDALRAEFERRPRLHSGRMT